MSEFANDGPDVLPVLGWREWLALPELKIRHIKAKVDTGARSSALHTHWQKVYTAENGTARVRFGLRPFRTRPEFEVACDVPVIDVRVVKDSGGHAEKRPFIQTTVRLGSWSWPAEMSLTNRETMLFRMLLGRSALSGRFLVDPARSYLSR
ncbi:MAG: RimK/LysX family protein [Verrucomicrobiales bacterium]